LDVDVLAAASQLVAQPWLPPLLLPWRSPWSQTLRLLLSALQVLKWPLWLLLSFQLLSSFSSCAGFSAGSAAFGAGSLGLS
jgi:hypothetical protein